MSILRRSNPTILIPIVAGIGNALMAVPMVRQLKQGLPDARIIVLARIRAMGEVFDRLAEVDQVHLMKKGSGGMARSMIGAQAFRADVCLIPFPSNRWQYIMLALASGARRRVLHEYPVGFVSGLGLVPADRLVAVKGLHDVVQNLYLLRKFGLEPEIAEAPRFDVNPSDREAAERLLRAGGVGGSFIAIHAGSARTILAQAKRWPVENYAAVISAIRERFDLDVVLLEGPDEAGVAGEIQKCSKEPLKVVRLSGPLAHAAAVLESAKVYVGSDSGLAHLAAAVGTPPVTLFAPSDPERVCPFGYRHLVIQPPGKECSPCFLYPYEAAKPRMRCSAPMCIASIPVEMVLKTTERALREAWGRQ
jgi:ADP-heptose:LPS heptosyltransferase